MEMFYQILGMLGGLAMFLYGMRLMGDGLKSSSGTAMKVALGKVTNNAVVGFLFGMFVTAMIQSSTATIVLTVGLVGAGLLSFRQSIGIVLGANVGTAITAQIIRLMDVDAGSGSLLNLFSAENLAPLALVLGIIFIMFVKKGNSETTGTILAGFGILFMGLIYMSDSVSTMGDKLTVLLTSFEDNYFLGFLSGVAVTGVIQSSSAVVGILQSLASSVGVRFCGVFAIIIGVNIGDCLTTFLVSRIGAKPEQIRTALVHVIYNICAAVLIIAALSVCRLAGFLSDDFWYASLNSGGVANVHGVFRLVPAVVLLPFSGFFASLAEKIVPEKPLDEEDALIEENLRALDEHLVSQPALALSTSAVLIHHMGDVALHNFEAVRDQIFNYERARQDRIVAREGMLDRMADSANRYLLKISPYIALEADNQHQGFQIKALTAFERIGDLAENCSEDIEKVRASNTEFSPEAKHQLRVALDAIQEVLQLAVEAYTNVDTRLARKIEPLEEVIDELIEEMKNRHIYRMTHNLCNVYANIPFEDILSNLERISDQCSDLAVYLLGYIEKNIMGKEHEYIHNLHHSNNQEYLHEFNEKKDKYFTLLEQIPTDQQEDADTSAED